MFVFLLLFGFFATPSAYAVLRNNSSAVDVLGQFADQDSAATPVYNKGCTSNGTSALGFNAPEGATMDTVNHRLFVSDCGNNRVLVFNLNGSNQIVDRTPDYVLGQTGFQTCEPKVSQAGMNCPVGLAYDGTNDRLFVSDQANHRVLVFDTSSISNGMNATNVLGATDFITSNSDVTAANFRTPSSLALDASNRLFVADTNNHRVMVFDVASITNGENAINVLGQPDFVTDTPDTTQSVLARPYGIAIDVSNNRLFVGEGGYPQTGRVMIFDVASITDGENAVNVLGKSDFVTASCDGGQAGLCYAWGLAFDPNNNRLFVGESYRILVFDTASITDGENAVNVIGQFDFDSAYWLGYDEHVGTPYGLVYDSTNDLLYTVDGGVHRVPIFDVSIMPNGPNAANVLGQGNFTSSGAATTQAGVSDPGGIAVDDVNNRTYVADTANNRVLVYDTASITNGENAAYVLGQPDFTSNSPATTQSGMSAPRGVALSVPQQFLFVADTGNHRVLVFDVSSISNGENAAVVLGQSNFTSGSPSLSRSRMDTPRAVVVDPVGFVFVSDSGNQRILSFDLWSLSDGMNAENVIGQTDFISNSTATTQTGLYDPRGVTLDEDNRRLFVVDQNNNRVLVYDADNISDGMSASNVIGQSDFTSSTGATTQAGLNGPYGIGIDLDGYRLFIVDGNRVLVHNVLSITDGQNAHKVIGQTNFTSNTTGTTQSTLSGAVGVAYDLNFDRLFVGDGGNNRVMVFSLDDITNGENAVNMLGQYTSLTSSAQIDSGKYEPHNNSNAHPYGFSYPGGVALDRINHRLFVSDSANHRVLVFNLNTDNSLPDRVPDNVLGQSDLFDAYWFPNNNYGMVSPQGLAFDSVNNRLFVADCNTNTNRVLVFDTASIVNGENATGVLGQPNFNTFNVGTTQSRFNNPCAVALDPANNRLFVADVWNNRILVFDVATVTNGEAATAVLGQTNYTNSGSATTQSRLYEPWSITFDQKNNRLFVGDYGNNRVMVFDTASITNGENAVKVIGQTNFVSASYDCSQNKFNGPSGVSYDSNNNRLFVSDEDNHRILVFDALYFSDGMNASNVLGQANYSTCSPGTSQTAVRSPQNLLYDPGSSKLILNDTGNNRILMFDGASAPFSP